VTYELALIAVVIGAGYWGIVFVRQQPHGTATFGVMQLAAAALAGLGLIGRRVDVEWLGVAGAIGIGAGGCLLVVGPMLRVLARRLVAAERTQIAMRLLDVVELLAPGSGIAEEKALVRAMAEIREGRIEHTVDALTAAKHRAPADAQLAIDERIAMLYLTAYRWSDAIQYAETHLFESPPPDDGDGSLRRALGVAPPVWVELLGAYGRIGDLEQSAKMLARLEDVCAGRDDAALWIHRGRVMFLALAGRIDAVRALVAPRQARHMTAAARTYWIAVAHDHRGDRVEAARAYEKARARSRGRPRELIERALATLAARNAPLEPGDPGDPAEPGGAKLAAVANAVVARIEAAPLPPPIRLIRHRAPRGAWLLTASMLAVSAATAIWVGDTADAGVLVRAGALVRGAVDAGQWWRLIACLFVHVGLYHLLLNATALFVIGRLAEHVFGGARMIAIFAGAGLAGAYASYLAAPVGISAGASGAVFGLLGAVFVELVRQRRRHQSTWTRGMWGRLAIVIVAQLAYGAIYPIIDQWAHAAGLIAGALLGLALSPSARWAAVAGYAARAIAVGFGVAAVIAGGFAVQTSYADTLTGGSATRREVVDGIAVTVPASWEAAAHQVFQPDGLAVVTLGRQPRAQPAQQIAMWIAEQGRRAKLELGEVTTAHAPVLALPDGWEGSELQVEIEDSLGYRQRMRMIVCGRAFGDAMIFTMVQVPETIARGAPEVFARLLASIAPA
jgi:membrane associated rhomboid family serine protease/tetratricopeptide (TPR) repeat protein